TDINYGNHLGNNALVEIIHEARMQFFTSFGFSEMDAGGISLIMSDLQVAYRNEAFYGDVLEIMLFCTEIQKVSFEILYEIKVTRENRPIIIAHAKTGMVGYNYQQKKVMPLTEMLKSILLPF